jgi:hypothetical protein
MPVTFQPVSDKPLEKVQLNARNRDKKDDDAQLIKASPLPPQENHQVTDNGFVEACCQAYNKHHHLVLRPDDVWMAILVQFSAFMESAGEAVRSHFVDHQDQKELTVHADGTLHTADYSQLSLDMSREIQKHLKDASVVSLVIPEFTTTTVVDRVSASIALMASMKKYFGYKFCLCCGLPQVTLLGTVEDWKSVEDRTNRLLVPLGQPQLHEWHQMLAPVLAKFTESFISPDLSWWNRICHYIGGGSGPTYLSGWITVFCVFNDEGKWIGNEKKVVTWGKVSKSQWPMIDTNDIPSGTCVVDVTVDDNGTKYKCELRAGHRFIEIMGDTSISPGVGWTLGIKKDRPVKPKGAFDYFE